MKTVWYNLSFCHGKTLILPSMLKTLISEQKVGVLLQSSQLGSQGQAVGRQGSEKYAIL